MWSKHPKSLPFLFLSEMWERFGYYLMIGIFTLYLKDVKTGFAMTEREAADLYGTFIALVFLTPFIGGLIADRYLGYSKSIVIGGLFMAAGYMLMGIHSLPMLYLAMTLVIVGNGFFKPNISTLLGNFYSTDKYRERKDEGYNIFYMGINVGAFICNFFGAALYNILGWQWAFFAAGVGMVIGVIVFIIGSKHYEGYTAPKGTKPGGLHQTHHLDHADPKSMHGVNTPDASTRYTPPTPKSYYVSPPWVPILMFVLLGLGSLVILCYYLGAVPGGRSNWYLFGGLACVLGGLFTATKYR
jgi:amino acid/peptide:H+ symporter